MTVILVLSTFLVFILIDFALSRKKVPQAEAAGQVDAIPDLGPNYVDGFLVPERLQYHPGHSWALRERKNLTRVGVDEFAAALLGRIERLELPKPGTWLRQGQKAFSFYRDGEKVEVLSPTEGEVVEVNSEVLGNLPLLRKDPYGAGWLLMVHSPDEETVSRNLIPFNMVHSWMQNAVERLYALQPQLAGAVAADGGRPAEDLLANLPNVSWQKVAAEFLLTA
ncbi:MAG: glycine cleavage system protein H [Bryobacterales bacterium]|nr:glycine cleavage system protein H [Bryobacterales bacterium]